MTVRSGRSRHLPHYRVPSPISLESIRGNRLRYAVAPSGQMARYRFKWVGRDLEMKLEISKQLP